jgi:FlaA1/EpsC-like NDP-sugar epimerase
MRLVRVNIFNTRDSLCLLRDKGLKNYFCVSTDKAANPVNMMGASKKIMEMFLIKESYSQKITMARFANVAFSKGSLLEGFKNRLAENQPISAPNDVARYFISSKEAGQLCLLSGFLGKNLDIFFPKLTAEFDLQKFTDIAIRFLSTNGYEAHLCSSEAEARDSAQKLISKRKWPCYFFQSETTGEKAFEEFYTGEEKLDMETFLNVGIINNKDIVNDKCLHDFEHSISSMLTKGNWTKRELVDCFNKILPGFAHVETGKNLDEKM